MKKLFALLAVVSLAAIGCDDKKSTTAKPEGRTTGGVYVKTDTIQKDTTVRITDTVVVNTNTIVNTDKVLATTTVKGGPVVPPTGKNKNGNDKD